MFIWKHLGERALFVSMYVYISIISDMQSMLFQSKVLTFFCSFDLLITWKSYVTVSIVGLFFPCSSIRFCFVCFEDLVLDEFKFGIILFLRINQRMYWPFVSPIMLFNSRCIFFLYFNKLYQPSFASVCLICHFTLHLNWTRFYFIFSSLSCLFWIEFIYYY